MPVLTPEAGEKVDQLAERVLKLPASDETRAEQANAQRILAEAAAMAQPPRLAQPAVGTPKEAVR